MRHNTKRNEDIRNNTVSMNKRKVLIFKLRCLSKSTTEIIENKTLLKIFWGNTLAQRKF
jgi:hypothetical protein